MCPVCLLRVLNTPEVRVHTWTSLPSLCSNVAASMSHRRWMFQLTCTTSWGCAHRMKKFFLVSVNLRCLIGSCSVFIVNISLCIFATLFVGILIHNSKSRYLPTYYLMSPVEALYFNLVALFCGVDRITTNVCKHLSLHWHKWIILHSLMTFSK